VTMRPLVGSRACPGVCQAAPRRRGGAPRDHDAKLSVDNELAQQDGGWYGLCLMNGRSLFMGAQHGATASVHGELTEPGYPAGKDGWG